MIVEFSLSERAAVAQLNQEYMMKLAFLATCKGIKGPVSLAPDQSGFIVEDQMSSGGEQNGN